MIPFNSLHIINIHIDSNNNALWLSLTTLPKLRVRLVLHMLWLLSTKKLQQPESWCLIAVFNWQLAWCIVMVRSHADLTSPKVRQLYWLALDWRITSAFILNPCSIFVKVSSCRCLITVQMNCFLSVNIFSLTIVESLGWWWFSYALNEHDINNSTDLV